MSAAEVETTLMSYHQDEKNGRLYVHTSDSLPPACHAMGASVTNANGLLLTGSKHDLNLILPVPILHAPLVKRLHGMLEPKFGPRTVPKPKK
jgi:hypothetical protein